tara:strand:+ start:30 stop:581 length:552 start_codon:yes stop_codon:yes gene_type:complete
MNWWTIVKYVPDQNFNEFSPFKSSHNDRKPPSFLDEPNRIIASDHYMFRLYQRGLPRKPSLLREFCNRVTMKRNSIPKDTACWSYTTPNQNDTTIILYSFNSPGKMIRAQRSKFPAPDGKPTLLLESIMAGGFPPRGPTYVPIWDNDTPEPSRKKGRDSAQMRNMARRDMRDTRGPSNPFQRR